MKNFLLCVDLHDGAIRAICTSGIPEKIVELVAPKTDKAEHRVFVEVPLNEGIPNSIGSISKRELADKLKRIAEFIACA